MMHPPAWRDPAFWALISVALGGFAHLSALLVVIAGAMAWVLAL